MFDEAKEKEYSGNLENSQNINALLIDVCKSQKETIGKMNRIICIMIMCFSLVFASMIICFYKYESQYETQEVTTTTTTTTMDASGENANINNVNDGNMYNDNATHNEGVK